MGIPVLASRSGFTAWGVEIARQVGLTLIGRMRGQRFVCLAGEERLIRDADPASQVARGPQAPPQGRRGGSGRCARRTMGPAAKMARMTRWG
jgi:FdhD protein